MTDANENSPVKKSNLLDWRAKKERITLYRRKRIARLREQGMCPSCTYTPVIPNQSLCAICKQKNLEQMERMRRRKGMKIYHKRTDKQQEKKVLIKVVKKAKPLYHAPRIKVKTYEEYRKDDCIRRGIPYRKLKPINI